MEATRQAYIRIAMMMEQQASALAFRDVVAILAARGHMPGSRGLHNAATAKSCRHSSSAALIGGFSPIPSSRQQRSLVAGVSDFCAVDLGEGRQLVLFRFRGADDFEGLDSANEERVGDERAMASPWYCFRAHQCRLVPRSEFDRILKGFREFGVRM